MTEKATEKVTDNKKVYNVTEFAKRLGKSRGHIYILQNKGILKPKKTITGKPYYTEADVTYYFNDAEV